MIDVFRCMKPEKIKELPDNIDGKVFQEKVDGGNVVIEVHIPIVKVYHARWNKAEGSFTIRTYRYPELVKEIQTGNVLRNHAVYIGELTCADSHGTGKQRIFMKRQVEGWKINQLSKHLPVLFYPHHIIKSDGQMLNTLTYEEMLRLLSEYVHEGKYVRNIQTFDNPQPLIEQKNRGIEGIVIKDLSSVYHFGKRGKGWSKIKFLHEEKVKFISYNVKEVGINLFTDEGFEVHLAGERVNLARNEIDTKGFVNAELEFLEKTESGYRDCSIKRIGDKNEI